MNACSLVSRNIIAAEDVVMIGSSLLRSLAQETLTDHNLMLAGGLLTSLAAVFTCDPCSCCR